MRSRRISLDVSPPPPTLIQTQAGWAGLAASLHAATAVAVDLEGDGFHRYPERVALIQVALPDGQIYLVDPLAVGDLAELGRALSRPDLTTVMHAADYDLRSLDRDFGFRLTGLFDTAIGAALIGLTRTGLANVVEAVLGVSLAKPKRLQRLDWSQRPLPADALAYASGDVAYLFDLQAALTQRLDQLGRLEWLREECARLERVRYVPPDGPEVAFLAVAGARDLSPKARAVLKELYAVREEEALRIGRPPHRVMSAGALLALAGDPQQSLSQVPGLPPSTLRRAGDRVRAALRRGVRADPVEWPRSGGRNPWTPQARQRWDRLRQWRAQAAADLGLDVGLAWPAAHLERLALKPEADLAELDADGRQVRRWQWQALGESLAEFVAAGFPASFESGPQLPAEALTKDGDDSPA